MAELPRLPLLTLKERPVIELLDEDGFEREVTEGSLSTAIFVKRCRGGHLTLCTKLSKLTLEISDNVTVQMEAPLVSGLIEVIGCSGAELLLNAHVPVVSLNWADGCTIHISADLREKEFQLLSYRSGSSRIHYQDQVHEVPATEETLITRFLGGAWTTEKVIYEGGYQTTQREREINLARAERDDRRLAASVAKGIRITRPPRPPRPPQGAQGFSAHASGPPDAAPPEAAPPEARLGRVLNPDPPADELTEFRDEPAVLAEKVKELVAMIRRANYAVAYTGAGISHSSGIATYRGPNGLWTLKEKGLPPPPSVALDEAVPTSAHMALLEMLRAGHVRHIVSTNLDGLHRRSGVAEEELSELHGNCYKENCSACGREHLRTFDITKKSLAALGGARADHLTGRSCEACSGALVDNVVNFGEPLPEKEIRKAEQHSSLGDLALVLGTSMKVSPACNLPDRIWKKEGGAMVIVNLQRTPYDRYAKLRIFGETDTVLEMVREELGLPKTSFANEPPTPHQ